MKATPPSREPKYAEATPLLIIFYTFAQLEREKKEVKYVEGGNMNWLNASDMISSLIDSLLVSRLLLMHLY